MTTKDEKRSGLPGTQRVRQGFELMGRKDRFCLGNTTQFIIIFSFSLSFELPLNIFWGERELPL